MSAKLEALPAQPGVYVFRDRRGEVLYVGKAKRLDQRVRSHFQDPGSVGPKQVALIRRVHDVEYIAVESEIDALILEATLVREKQPPYNIRLKDDKRYPYVRISWEEDYPRLTLVRRARKDGARYFGPYTEVKGLRQLLRLTRSIFPMRSCRDIESHIAARRECLDFHIGRCGGPCIGAQSREEYRAMVEQFCDFLSGKREQVVERFRALLESAAARREYERAAKLRDQIRRLETILARQRMVDVGGASVDVVGVARGDGEACAVVLKIRDRRVVSRDVRWLRGAGAASDAEVSSAFVGLYYAPPDAIPETLVVEGDPEERALLEAFLTRAAASESPVRIRAPRDPGERLLARTARRNAAMLLARARGESARALAGAAGEESLDLQRALGLPRPPRRIRCFDVSNLQGTYVVASMTTFLDGRPAKGEYRKFRIRTVEGQDDFASIAEAVRRHARRVAEGALPAADLYVIDGGAGQLSAARAAAGGTPLEAAPFVGLAKRFEEIVKPDGGAVRLPRRSPGLRLLQRARDEAHRFAVAYHRSLRGKGARASALDEVPGLGPRRRARLLARFGSVAGIRRERPEALAAVPGIGPALAARIAAALAAAEGGDS
ncbi:MAG TPA: excinuclease ABC subunit UvrC [Acidobacteriota bacterium]|nr:excinuclease ABC subunit UvrC [Acidobacteriota bacterium]